MNRAPGFLLVGALLLIVTACSEPAGPAWTASAVSPEFSASDEACWGQASAVFAQMGEMGEHSSGEPTPRLGLRNLARALAEAGVIEDDTMQALGAFVAMALGLSIEACM